MDIDTPEGLEQAKEWMTDFLKLVKEGAGWAVPRSSSIYALYPKAKRIVRVSPTADPSIEFVCKELGFTVEIGPNNEGVLDQHTKQDS